MKIYRILIALAFSFATLTEVKSQVNFGITSGTPTLVGAELGYSINEKVHVGVVAWPKLGLINEPGFYGGFFRKTFKEEPIIDMGPSSFVIRPLVFAMIGTVSSIETTYFDSNLNVNYKTIPAQLGGCVGGGVELGVGKMVIPIEIGFGKMPSTFTTLSNITSENPKSTSALYLNTGIRFYLAKRL